MTVDDSNSIYVGSLPYSATEDTIRRVFGPYGAIVAIKIINDHGVRGKCYCFVTFTNPRSVIDAINDMNGKTIDGRVVRVSGATTRGGRSNRERFRGNADRGMDWDRGRDRERDYDRDRDKYRERYSDRSRERDRSWDHDEDGERRRDFVRDHDQARDGFLGRDQSQDRVLVDSVQEGRNNGWNWETSRGLHSDHERETDAVNGARELVHKETDHDQSRKLNDSRYNDQRSREVSSDSSDYYNDKVEERLKRSIKRRDELKKEICQMEDMLEDKQHIVSNLQKRTQILEDKLIMAKKSSSQQKMQLTNLHTSFLQVKEYSERLKSCEQELQSLVDSAITQSDLDDDVCMGRES